MNGCGWHSGPLQEQVLLISKPSLQPLILRRGGVGRKEEEEEKKDTGTIACY